MSRARIATRRNRTSTAQDDLSALSRPEQERILNKLDEIVDSPWRNPPEYGEPLQSSPHKKVRTGTFRLAVTFRRSEQRMIVARITRRGGAYTADDDRGVSKDLAGRVRLDDPTESPPASTAIRGECLGARPRVAHETFRSSRSTCCLGAVRWALPWSSVASTSLVAYQSYARSNTSKLLSTGSQPNSACAFEMSK